MPVLQASGIADILVAGLAELGEGKWTDLSFDKNDYVVLPELMKQDRITIQSGHSIQWTVITDENYTFRMTGLYAQDNLNVPNVLTQGSVPWRHAVAGYAFDQHEITMNEGMRQIVPIMREKRHPAMVSIANGMERGRIPRNNAPSGKVAYHSATRVSPTPLGLTTSTP